MSVFMPHILMKINKEVHTIPTTAFFIHNNQTLENIIVTSDHPIIEAVYNAL